MASTSVPVGASSPASMTFADVGKKSRENCSTEAKRTIRSASSETRHAYDMGGSAAVAVVGPCPSRAPLVAAAAASLASSAPSSVGAVADCEDAHAAARSALALSEPMALSRAASMLVKAAAVVTAAIAELLALRTWDATTINVQVLGEEKCMACGDDYRNMAEVDDKSRVVPHDEREHEERSRHVDREPKRCSRTQRANHLHKQDTEQQCGAPSVGGAEGR